MGAAQGVRPGQSPPPDSDLYRDLSHKISTKINPAEISRASLVPEDLKERRSRAKKSQTSLADADGGKGLLQKRISRMFTANRNDMIQLIEQASESGGHASADLEDRLHSFGMQTMVMQGDGNCQFRSLAFNLFGSEKHHAAARKGAVEHIRRNADFFKVFFEDEAEFKDYLSSMGRCRTWGDELTLRAAVEAYGCEAHVITSEPANWYLVYKPDCEHDPGAAICPKGTAAPPVGKTVFLAYVSPVHYNAIITRTDSRTGRATE